MKVIKFFICLSFSHFDNSAGLCTTKSGFAKFHGLLLHKHFINYEN